MVLAKLQPSPTAAARLWHDWFYSQITTGTLYSTHQSFFLILDKRFSPDLLFMFPTGINLLRDGMVDCHYRVNKNSGAMPGFAEIY